MGTQKQSVVRRKKRKGCQRWEESEREDSVEKSWLLIERKKRLMSGKSWCWRSREKKWIEQEERSVGADLSKVMRIIKKITIELLICFIGGCDDVQTEKSATLFLKSRIEGRLEGKSEGKSGLSEVEKLGSTE